MAKKFLVNIDLTKNELQNVVIHKLAVAPSTPVDGQIYFNTSDERYYLRTSTGWKDVSGRLDDIVAGSTCILLTDNGDGTITLDVAEASITQKGVMSATDKAKLDNATSAATADTIVERDANGDVAVNDLTANDVQITSASNTWGANSAVTKSYVDNLISGGINIVGTIDASTNPDYPVANIGDAWHISVAGRIGGGSGELVQIGDLVVAVAASVGGDEATVGDDFIIMQKNIDSASETVEGTIRIATQAEVDAGTATDIAVTPAGMATYIDNLDSASQFASDVGLGDTTKDFVVNHALSSVDVQVQIKDNTTLELVEADVTITDTNNILIHFNKAPALNEYRIIVQG